MALDMHLKLEGGTVKFTGDSKHTKHTGEIAIMSWQWGMSQAGSFADGKGNAGKANIADISLSKMMDKSSGQFIKALTTGAKIDKATLTMSQASDKQEDYLVIVFEKVMVTSYQTGCSEGQDTPIENLTLTFAKFSFDHKTANDKGAVASDGIVEYDMLAVSGK